METAYTWLINHLPLATNQNPYSNYYQAPGYSTGPGYPNYSQGFDGYNSGFSITGKRLNGLEILVAILATLAVIGSFTWGLLTANTNNRDLQRQRDIFQVMEALDNFYTNSNRVPSQRAYPKAVCSGDLNEVDFESTLRLHLTGQKPELDNHAYIASGDFPKDKWGDYDVSFGSRRVPFRCPSLLGTQPQSYPDSYPSCNFSSSRQINKCYLYTSSNNGDTYQIAYFSEAKNKFVVYRRFLDNPAQLVSG